MARRWCPACAAEVEDVGGYCLLGHSLLLAAPDLDDFQSEIAAGFAATRGQIEMSLRLVGANVPADPAVPTRPSVPPEESPGDSTDVLAPPVPAMATPGPSSPPQPLGTASTPPPPPPSPTVQKVATLFDQEEANPRLDPITAFAPAPSMDWGPNKPPRRRSILRRAPGEE